MVLVIVTEKLRKNYPWIISKPNFSSWNQVTYQGSENKTIEEISVSHNFSLAGVITVKYILYGKDI